MATTPLSQIPTLSLLYKLNRLTPASSDSLKPNSTSKFNDKIGLIRMDITKLETSAIVNAANESLLGGGGVDGAIHRAAGPQLLEECERLNGCDTGDAKMTDAYRLPCEKIIHTVGPVYWTRRREGTEKSLLRGCYQKSLDLCVGAGCRSVAFSALSTGVYGYPSEDAAETAIGAVKDWLEEDEERADTMDLIVFCNFMEKDERAYEMWLPRYFPPTTEEEKMEGDEGMKDVAESGKADDVETEVPDLPDVPTTEPTEPGQPSPKKARLEEGSEEKL